MASALRLTGALEQRTLSGMHAIQGAQTPDEQLQAAMSYLRSLTAMLAKLDPAVAKAITEAAAKAVRGAGDDVAQAVRDHIQSLSREVAA